jgi:tRNA A-37 threonylcarbamoyl transferase component Bud32
LIARPKQRIQLKATPSEPRPVSSNPSQNLSVSAVESKHQAIDIALVQPLESKGSHRKTSSLYIKNTYLGNAVGNIGLSANNSFVGKATMGLNPATRQSSVERGIVSMSKDINSGMASLNGSQVRLRATSNGASSGILPHSATKMATSGRDNEQEALAFSQLRNKMGAGSNLDDGQTGDSSKGARATKPLLKVNQSVQHSRNNSLVSQYASAAAGQTGNHSQVERLKKTFFVGPKQKDSQRGTNQSQEIDQGSARRDHYGAKHGGSSTRFTLDPEVMISWREDIDLDVENELAFISCLGQGSFAKVYEATEKKTSKTVAVKVIDKRKINDHKRKLLIQTEVSIMYRMKHPNLVEFLRLIEDKKRIFMVMQLCGSLTLNHFCRQFQGKKLNEEQAYAIFVQIVKGVRYMHEHNVAHRDLKLTNILIDDEYTVKIIDFGFACAADEKHKMYCGTPSYMSPEVVEKRLYNPKPVDIWAMGVILFKLLTGEYAFGGKLECYPS